MTGSQETDLEARLWPFLKVAKDATAKGDPVGLVALVWRKGEIFDAAVGLRNVEESLPMRRDTIFRIASMTKPITSVLTLILMEEGKLRLNDPVAKWAPELANRRVLKDPEGPIDNTYPSPREITIEDLFTHRSGLAFDFSARGPIADAYRRTLENLIALGPDEFLGALATLPLCYAPGERWRYGESTNVLGVIAGRIGGKPFRDVLRDRILEPLGMNGSSSKTRAVACPGAVEAQHAS
jgi:CubicO group peptidase (beta-lactamase class C family)